MFLKLLQYKNTIIANSLQYRVKVLTSSLNNLFILMPHSFNLNQSIIKPSISLVELRLSKIEVKIDPLKQT